MNYKLCKMIFTILFIITLLVSVFSPVPSMVFAVNEETEIPEAGGQIQKEKLISLNFNNTDIDLVLKFFSEITGYIFIKSDMVRGNVTVISPIRIPANEALDILEAILEVKGLTIIKSGKVMKVVAQGEAGQKNVETKIGLGETNGEMKVADSIITQVFSLQFMSVNDMRGFIQPLISRNGTILTNEQTNSLVIVDVESNIKRIIKIIQEVDVQTPQVLIEALIVEIGLTDETKLGLEWNYKNEWSATGSGHRVADEVNQTFGLSNFITEGIKYSVVRDDKMLSATLQMLATNKEVNILSAPRILASNSREATIRVGEEVPVLKESRIGGTNSDGSTTVIKTYDYKDVSVLLTVLPRINSRRDVSLKINQVVKKILGTDPELQAPILATREAKTEVVVKDKQTIVIGGLIEDDDSKSISKIPILGDIPVIGWLFKRRGVSVNKKELLVFITPRVVLNYEDANELLGDEEFKTKLDNTPNRIRVQQSYETGVQLYKSKDYIGAIDKFEESIKLDSRSSYAKKSAKYIKKAKRKLAKSKQDMMKTE